MAFLSRESGRRLLGLLLGAVVYSTAPAAVSREYQIKAAFLFNFSEFVDWPPDAFTDPAAPFVIGVLGQDPFGQLLDALVQGQRIRGRLLVVRHYRQTADATSCQILYLGLAKGETLAGTLRALHHRPILTVGESEGFAQAGGMIRFLTEDRRIRFRINVGAVRASGLTISSNLLRPAEIVGAGKD